MTECRNRVIFAIMILGTLGGVASIVLIVLGEMKIGGIMILCWIPATIGWLEWRCRERGLRSAVTGNPKLPAPLEVMNSLAQQERPKRQPSLAVAEALPVSSDIRINIAPHSPGSK